MEGNKDGYAYWFKAGEKREFEGVLFCLGVECKIIFQALGNEKEA